MTSSYRSLFIGLDAEIPLLDGTCRGYVNLDHAASTPPLKAVQQAVDGFLTYYSSVHLQQRASRHGLQEPAFHPRLRAGAPHRATFRRRGD